MVSGTVEATIYCMTSIVKLVSDGKCYNKLNVSMRSMDLEENINLDTINYMCEPTSENDV